MLPQERGIWIQFNQYILETPLHAGELEDENGKSLYLELYHDKLIHTSDINRYVQINDTFVYRIDDQYQVYMGQNSRFWNGMLISQIGYDQLKKCCLLDRFSEKHQLLGRIRIFDGFVFECKKFANNQMYFVQILQKYELQQEYNILKVIRKLCHENLIRLQEVYREEGVTYALFNKFEGIPLQKLILSLSEKQLASYIYQLLGAIKHMHDKFLNHNAINEQNIVVCDKAIYLINFESASPQCKNDDLKGVYNILKKFLARDFSSSFKDFFIKIQTLSLGQTLYHQWFINRHIRFDLNGLSLVTILEKTENDVSQIDLRKSEELYQIEQEDSGLFQNYTSLKYNYLIPSRMRRE